MTLPTLRTGRLLLRPWTIDDVETLHRLWTQPQVRRYLWDDEVITLQRAEETVRRALESAGHEGVGLWLIVDVCTGETVGFAGLVRREDAQDPELMYGLDPCYWGRGFATEASQAVLAYAFGTLLLPRVTAATDAPNTASVRVMERLGMRFVRRGLFNGLDTIFYELRRDDVDLPARTRRLRAFARLPAEHVDEHDGVASPPADGE